MDSTRYLKYFTNHDDYEQYIADTKGKLPNVSYCENVKDVHYNPYSDEHKHLTFIALEDGTIKFEINQETNTDLIRSISYSTDNGKTWTTTENQDNKEEHLQITVPVSEGDKVLWKGDATTLCQEVTGTGYVTLTSSSFVIPTNVDVRGNVMSMLYGDDFEDKKTLTEISQLAALFCDWRGHLSNRIINAKNLSLPATTLTRGCYQEMFAGCEYMLTAPKLPATTMATNCYQYMFDYNSSLIETPKLPAMQLASGCYYRMFRHCTTITKSPKLPATTLYASCYREMFGYCTNLEHAPELPALELVTDCYRSIFYDCHKINYIKAMFLTTPVIALTRNWVNGVAATGTFVKNANATWDVTGVNGVPTGWTVRTETPD